MKITCLDKNLNNLLLKSKTKSVFCFKADNNSFDVFVKSGCINRLDEKKSFCKVVGTFNVYNRKTKVFEKCAMLCFQDENSGSFKLVKNNKEKMMKIENYLKFNDDVRCEFENSCYLFTPQIRKTIAKTDRDLLKDIDDLIIAEASYNTLNKPEEIKKLAELGYEKVDKSKDTVLAHNFILYQKDFDKAAKKVMFSLFGHLKNTNQRNLVIKAAAFGENPVSPINYYLRLGFLPLGVTFEDIEKHKIQTSKGVRISPDYRILMYLPSNAVLYDLQEKFRLGEV